jgi:tripartite-type tricarboxylate transporter receptor subunit TctC
MTRSTARRTRRLIVAASAALPAAAFLAPRGAHAQALFAKRAGAEWGFVPYKGGAQALNDLAAGQSDVMFNGMLATLPFVQAGKLRALGIASDTRWSTVPDLPTVAEQGFPGFMTGSWQGLLAPAGTPAPVVARIAAEFARALAVPEVTQRLTAQGAEPRTQSPAEFGAFIRSETAKWAQLVKETGIRAE